MHIEGFQEPYVTGNFNDDLRAYQITFKSRLTPLSVAQAFNWAIPYLQVPEGQVHALILDFTQVHHFHTHSVREFQKQSLRLSRLVNLSRFPTLFVVHSSYQEQIVLMLDHACHLDGVVAICKSKAAIMHHILLFQRRTVGV